MKAVFVLVMVAAVPLAVAFGQTAQTRLPPAQQGRQDTTVPLAPAPFQPILPEDGSPPPRNVWLTAGAAKLQALDKVNAQALMLTIKVGKSATFGSLTIKVRACMTRPLDQPTDAAAFVDVTDSHPDQPRFDGWLLLAEPAASMLQHPLYDLRVAGCAA
jgi:hypothetical protein